MKIFIALLINSLFLISCGNIENNDIKNNNINLNPKTILAIGDSLTAGYSLNLEDSYPMQLEKILNKNGYNYEVINAGVSGDTSEQLLKRIDLYINEKESLPNIAILVIGGNDGLRGKNLNEIEQNIELIIKKLKAKNVNIVFGGMKIPPNLGFNYSNNFFKLYKKISNNNNVFLIDFFLEGVAGQKNLNLNDGIHPNKQGYKIISENIFKFLENNNLIKND